MKRTPLYMAVAGLTLSAASTITFAQDSGQVIEEVIVTGSYIPGSPEDAAVPIDVVTAEDMSKQGSPDMLEFLKNQPVSAGVLGDSNQFDSRSQGADGSGTVNLRGLGPQRTLVLINGKRVANNPSTGSVDTNLLPLAAMGRIEVLKDGAAVLYGSDAIAGVVNFITKDNLDGFELGLDHKFIDGSDGDTQLKANWGWVGDNQNVLVSFGYQQRTELDTLERDWLDKPFLENPDGGWTGGGSPTGYVSLSNPLPAGDPNAGDPNPLFYFQDPGCGDLGGTNYYSSPADATIPRCRFNYTDYDNLIDPLDRYQLYSEYNITFGPDIEFHIEGSYSKTETEYNTSPSYLATQAPYQPVMALINAALPTGAYYIPLSSPGLQSFRNTFSETYLLSDFSSNSVSPPANASGDPIQLTTNGVVMAPLTFRPFGIGGNPLYGGEGVVSDREYEQIRFVTGLNGMIGGSIGWDVSVAYSEVENYREGEDTIVNRFAAALFGLGGPNCATITPGANGCHFFNPFSTGIERNGITGQLNPNYDPSVSVNNPELNNWLFVERWDRTTNTNFTLDAVFNGDLGLELPGGMIQWAAGLQYRDNEYERRVSENQNLDTNPCVAAAETVLNPNFTSCADAGLEEGGGIFMFLGGSYNSNLDSDVKAAFAEFRLPILDTLEMTLALRYEDYGGETGDTTDPKLALRWQATDWMAFRGSYSSTFRAPTVVQLAPGSATALQNIDSSFRAIDIFGDSSLQPESADTYNLGVIFDHGGLYASLDYWRFDLTETLGTEPLQGMVSSMFGDPDTTADDNCGLAAYAGLEGRFNFSDENSNGIADDCDIGNIARVRINNINGADRTIDGIDWSLSYAWDLASGDVFTLGTAGSYTHSLDLAETTVEGIVVEEARDAAGFLNQQTTAYPLPKKKGNIYGEYTMGDSNFRLTARGIDSYEDQRNGDKVDSWVTYDFNYRYILATDFAETVFNVSLENITDEDPPFVKVELDYDSFTHSPLGRTIKLGVNATF